MSTDVAPVASPSPDALWIAPDAQPVPDERSARRRTTLQLFAVLLLLTAALRLPAFFVDVFNSDESFLGAQAEVISDGGNLYQEAADRKPPLVPYLYAATFTVFGTTALWSVRVMAMLAVALTALFLALEARRRYGNRAAWIAGVLMVLASVAFAPQDGQAANFEIFMLPSMTAAVLLARRGRAFSSGAAVALATLAKQTGAATLLPVLYLLWRQRGRRGAADALGGFALPLTVVALLVGPGELLFWTTIGNGSYLGISGLWGMVLLTLLLMTAAFAVVNAPIVWALPRAWRERRTAGSGDTDLWLWLLSAVVSVAVGLRFFGHYYLQLLPPLVLITTGVLMRSSGRAVKRTIALAAAIAVVAMAFLPVDLFIINNELAQALGQLLLVLQLAKLLGPREPRDEATIVVVALVHVAIASAETVEVLIAPLLVGYAASASFGLAVRELRGVSAAPAPREWSSPTSPTSWTRAGRATRPAEPSVGRSTSPTRAPSTPSERAPAD